jgi:uncharacterized protein (UPF0261 family)
MPRGIVKTVSIIGTCDTKGPELAYVRDRLKSLNVNAIVIDSGILGEPLGIVPEIDRATVATYGGTTIEALRNAGSRGKAVRGMREALRKLMIELYKEKKIDGAIGMGGAEGAVMSAAAMMVLPLGVPKILVSPIASGHHFFHPLVGTSDMMVVHSVVDILGLNPIACTVFDNVVAAMKGMLESGHSLPKPDPSQKYVAVTMLGNTTKAVMALKERLHKAAYEAVIFHSNGVGGPAMEELAQAGQFVGVIDYTTNEVYDPLVGGIHDGGERRLEVVGQLGLPQVIVPGCIDFSVWNTGTVPSLLKGRPFYDHNPEFILVRASHEEMIELGHIFARKLNTSKGKVEVMVPTQGLSIPNIPDGPFWNPEADADFLKTLRSELRSDIPITTLEHHVNDPWFGQQVAEAFIKLMEE